MLISSKLKRVSSDNLNKCVYVDYVFLLLALSCLRGLCTSSSLTKIKAVELTNARRYVNMCKSVCFYIRLSRRIVHWNSMGGCRFQEVSYKDTSLFVCL